MQCRMKSYRAILLILILSNLPSFIYAQHCPWDGSRIIMVDVRDSVTGESIQGLEVALADSKGSPYNRMWSDYHKELSIYQKGRPLKFGQNLRKKEGEHSQHKYPFPFGLNCYILIVHSENYPEYNAGGKDLILIKDKAGHYKNASIAFDAEQIAHLCTNSPIWDEGEVLESVIVKVKLEKMD